MTLEIQDRDIRLLRDLFVSRIMTMNHIAALHFDNRAEAAKKRIQKLKAEALIAERPRRARDPAILYLTRQGYVTLFNSGSIQGLPQLSLPAVYKRAQVSELTLRHELAVMDFKAAMAPAIARTPGLSVVEFNTWPSLNQFDVYGTGLVPIRVKPDAFIRVNENDLEGNSFEHAFFVEVDRGTETVDTLARRASYYREHYATGGYAQSCGADRNDYAAYPFRVLMVFTSDERRNNVAERLLSLHPPIESHSWLTTTTEVTRDPLGAIWLRPRDYREALHDTEFGKQPPGTHTGYKRQPKREVLVRERAPLMKLFAD